MVDADGRLIQELKALAVPLALQAGKLILAQSGRSTGNRTKTSGRDLVTDTDLAVERFLVGAITAARPDDAVLTEETGIHGGSGPVLWLLDPIDGTTNFVHGLPGFVVSIAAQIAGRTVVAAIHDPVHRETFVSSLGGPATRNGAKIKVSETLLLNDALVATGFAPDDEARAEQMAVLARLLPAVRDVRSTGVCAYELCQVACGRLDGYVESRLQPWDHAAWTLIVTAAGGAAMVDRQPTGDTVIAGTPAVASQLQQGPWVHHSLA